MISSNSYYDRYIRKANAWAKDHNVSPPKTGM